MLEDQKKSTGKLGIVAYPFRLLGYYFALTILILYVGGFQFLAPLLIGFISIVILYPHVGYILYKFSDNNKKLEYFNLGVDALLLGGFINLMNFAIIPCCVFAAMIISSHAALQGMKRVGYSGLLIGLGVAIVSIFNGLKFEIVTTPPINIISTVALSMFSIVYSYLGYVRWISLRKAKTSLKYKRQELEQKKVQLEEISSEKDYLIGIAAHDLKSPLNQIIALIQIIELSESIPDGQMENLFYINRSAQRMRAMIGKILDIHAIESGEFNFNYEVFDIRDDVNEVLEAYKKDADNKQIQLHYSPFSTPCNVKLDRGYFIQIVENLLSNALKFSPRGKNIYLKVLKKDGNVRLEVKDEGPGISNEDKRQLFKKFQRLSARPTGDEPSSGLGLSIVKKFTEAMNGEIRCESVLGNGATFIVDFHEARAKRMIPT